MNAELNFIGHILTPYQYMADCPHTIQPDGPLCKIVLYEGYQVGLSGLHAGQEILLVYWFEGTDRNLLKQMSRDGATQRGTFALRSPHRPNPIGIAVLPIEKIEYGEIFVKGLDCLTGTKLIDIKPALEAEIPFNK
ncbi:TrmO family methyltransferase domain-containing protein [Vibrio sp. RC27]